MRVGLTAYDVHAVEFLALAAAADEAGFSSLWLGEHVVLPIGFATEHPTKHQPGVQHHTGPIVSPDTELVDPLVQLGAAAAVTTRIELATGIFILPLRHPLAVARSSCTVQELAGGRFTFGLGFGWLEEEFTVLDVPFGERITRFEESIEVLRAAWRGGEVRHEGKHFSISGVQVTKRPTRIPLMLGGNTKPRCGERHASVTAGSPPVPRRSRSRSASAASCNACEPRATGPMIPSSWCSAWRAPTPEPFADTRTKASTRSSSGPTGSGPRKARSRPDVRRCSRPPRQSACRRSDGTDTNRAVRRSPAVYASGMSRPKASRVIVLGSGPPRMPVSRPSMPQDLRGSRPLRVLSAQLDGPREKRVLVEILERARPAFLGRTSSQRHVHLHRRASWVAVG